jgi:hypothetical protein
MELAVGFTGKWPGCHLIAILVVGFTVIYLAEAELVVLTIGFFDSLKIYR